MIALDMAGLEALEKRLGEVVEKVAKKALRSAARKAMTYVRKEARDNAPEDTGLLENNFALLTKIKGSDVIAKVGVRGGGKENDSTPFYFRFQEFGTKNIPAKPFLRPALESNADKVLETVVEELNKALDGK